MIHRNLTRRILAALGDTPVVLLHGARQTGKTTLVRQLARDLDASYVTFDDAAVLASAQADAEGFISRFTKPAVIDEVQRLPEIAVTIKAAVDRNRRPGRFLLTGSANVLQVPRLSDSLAGRMEILPLWPFSQGEIGGVHEDFIATLFAREALPVDAVQTDRGAALVERACAGGYPEVQQRKSADRRHAWFSSYISTILQRDIRDLSSIEGLTALPRLLALLASRAGALMNYADVARGMQMPQSTLKRYLSLLETTFLIQLMPPWSGNLGLRLVKSPKLYLSDTGLLVHLLNLDPQQLASPSSRFGFVLENLVAIELRKQLSWSSVRAQLFHFRTQNGKEVDFVLEGPGGQIVGVEVKSTASITSADFHGLKYLADSAKRKFHKGVVLYAGAKVLPFGTNLWAMPAHALWQERSS